MNKQIYYINAKTGSPDETIIAENVVIEFAQWIIDNLNYEFGGPKTAKYFKMRDQP